LTFCEIEGDEDNYQIRLKDEILEELKDCPEEIAYLESVIKTIPKFDNPQTLDQFNYHYVDGKLVNIDTGKPFHWVNQKHYDSLGDIIIGHIQKLMVEDCLMDEVLLPIDEMDYDGPFNNIFVSKNVYTCDKLMLLIQGSGAVRAGMWARALCINNDISLGSVIPYIKKSMENGFGVIVLNPNFNSCFVPPIEVKRNIFLGIDGEKTEEPNRVKIKGNETPVDHVLYVWDNIVSKTVATRICIVAHSAGGHGAVQLLKKREEDFYKVCGIAFTDSVHSVSSRDNKSIQKFIKDRCRNWVTSDEEIDTVVNQPFYDCLQVSAGHTKHEFTSGVAVDSVIKFLVDNAENMLK